MWKNVLAVWGAFSLVAFIVLASPAMGEGAKLAPHSTPYSDAWPPERYDQDEGATVVFVNPRLIASLCGAPPKGMIVEACEDEDRIILPNPCGFPKTDEYARLACHEKAHRSGWPGTHGD